MRPETKKTPGKNSQVANALEIVLAKKEHIEAKPKITETIQRFPSQSRAWPVGCGKRGGPRVLGQPAQPRTEHPDPGPANACREEVNRPKIMFQITKKNTKNEVFLT